MKHLDGWRGEPEREGPEQLQAARSRGMTGDAEMELFPFRRVPVSLQAPPGASAPSELLSSYAVFSVSPGFLGYSIT